MKNYSLFLSCVALLFFSGLMFSCKKYADPPPVFEVGDSLVVKPPRKVLFIAIDGVPGAEMKAIMPTNIASLLPKSKYSWDVLSEVTTTTVASWKTLLSGVNSSQHNILGLDSTFAISTGGTDYEGKYIPFYPSFFNYILTTPQNDLRSAFITGWSDLIRFGAPEVTDRMPVSSDAAVKDSAVRLLKSSSEDLIIANFSDPARVGLSYGFSNTVPEYKASIQKVDGYIGDLLNALRKDRATYNKEEWLVIIASTHGGINKSFGGASEAEKRTFAIYNYDLFKQQEFTAQGVYSAVEFGGNGTSAPLKIGKLNDANEFNIGAAGKQLTIQYNFKSPSAFSYPHYFGKQLKFAADRGWTMFTNASGTWCISIRGTAERRMQLSTKNIFDGAWHRLAFAVYDSGGRRWVKRFLDGERLADPNSGGNNRDLTDIGDISNTEPLLLGWGADKGYGAITFSIANLALFNTVLSDAEILDNACLPAEKINTHPKYGNLVAYYPGNDGFGGKLNNMMNSQKPIVLSGSFSWNSLSAFPCAFQPGTTPAGKIVKQWYNVDISSQIFYWFRIEDWKKEGDKWLNEYEIEFIK